MMARKLKITTLMIFYTNLVLLTFLYVTLMLSLPPTQITYVTVVGAQSELTLFWYLVGTPDSVKHALTDDLFAILLHAVSITCSFLHVPFSEHFTLRSHYTPFTVLLLLHAVSFTCAFHSISITRLIHYTPFPLFVL